MIIDCIEEFIKLKADEYFEKCGISKEHLEIILRSPFKYMKIKIEDEKFDTIRLKFFGSLQVFQGTAKGFLAKCRKKYEKGYMSVEDYNKIKDKVTKIIKNN